MFYISDYIWQVEIKPKGLGVSKHLSGGYRFCLQDTVCFVKNNSIKVEFEIQVSAVYCSMYFIMSCNWLFVTWYLIGHTTGLSCDWSFVIWSMIKLYPIM
jgi:hypothetical protein